MNSKSKRRTRVREDRISALPDALIGHILSFLPTLKAVRTTVLSKRWNNIWTSMTTLDFDDARDRGITFTKFVNRVLFFRDSSDIRKFRLFIWYLLTPDLGFIDDWICTAVRRNVVELHLGFLLEVDSDIPRSVFTCTTLRSLRLQVGYVDCLIPSDYPPSVCFPSLKFLHVTLDCPDPNLPQKLFSCCPVVEEMIIDGWVNAYNCSFNVWAPELKSLRLKVRHYNWFEGDSDSNDGDSDSNDEISDSDYNDEINFHISAPKLEKLELKRVAFSNYNLENVESLVSASISFEDKISASRLQCFSTSATELLDRISNVKYLSLSTHYFKVSFIPAFNNLKKLDLLLHKCNYWELLADLLYRAPNLEDMVLENKTRCRNDNSDLLWNPPEAVPICLLSHLKTITIKGFKVLRVEMGVAKYLLNNGHVLNKLTLYTGFLYTKAEEMYKEVLMFHRAMSCQVEFYQR